MDNELLHNQENDNLTKSERKRLKKQAKKNQHLLQRRANNIKSIAQWSVAIGLIVGVVFVVSFLAKQAGQNWPGEAHYIEGREHVSNTESVEYKTNPPTSGNHYADAIDWGIYDYELQDERVVHGLEHGGIWISYKGVDEDTVKKIEAIARKYPNRVIASPRPENDSAIAVASWGRLLELDVFDEQKIIEYIKKNTNKSPEKLAR